MRAWSFVDGEWQRGDLPAANWRWFHAEGKADRDEFVALAGRFGLHPLAVEDCLSLVLHAPKIDDFEQYIFAVLLAPVSTADGPEAVELDAFLGKDFLVTHADVPLALVDEVDMQLSKGQTLLPGADGLLHRLFDLAVDDILPVADELSARVDSFAEVVLTASREAAKTNQHILVIRARAGRFRRVLVPLATVAQRLSRGEFQVIQPANRPYFRDVYDHLVRVDMVLEEVREDAEVAINTYLGVINNRMNEVMKVLSVVAALALPATVITGIFGTNFDDIPGLHSNWGFAAMIAAMAAISGGMFLFFRRRGWF